MSTWPGLAQVWSGQAWLGLILASFFALTLNAALLTRLVWTELVDAPLAHFFTSAAAATWILALAYTTWWAWRAHPEVHRLDNERLFRAALAHYLRQEWDEARRCCERILARDDSDSDTLVQLALCHQRLGNAEAAHRALRQCLATEGSAKWRWEAEQLLAKKS